MSEKLPSRPFGAREDDLSDLNDYTLEDIATAKLTSPEDRQNAIAEIAARKATGTYDPDNAPHESRSDLLDHGYGVQDGKILYPKTEYKAWRKSDRSLRPPIGIYRETIEDRAESLRKANKSLGETTLHITLDDKPISPDFNITEEAEEPQDTESTDEYEEYNIYDNLPGIERFPRPSKSSSERKRRLREREAHKKESDEELDSRRRFRSFNKYENTFLNQRKSDSAEARGNLPVVEKTTEQDTKHSHSTDTEIIDDSPERAEAIEEAEKRAEKLANVYEKNFPKYASEWLTRGVIDKLAHGILDAPDSTLLAKGFSLSEDDFIASRIDPESTLPYYELIGITGDLKRQVMLNTIATTNPFRPAKFIYIDQYGHEVKPKNAEEASMLEKKEVRAGDREIAIRRGITHAIKTGATVDPRTGEVNFSLPTEKGPALLKYMEENGIDTDSTTVQFSAQEGFANIIEAIKDKDSLTEEGFRALDWYFDNFKFKQHLEKFEDLMDGYQEYADPAWNAKYAEYMEHRRALDSSLEKAERKPTPTLKEAEEMSEEELLAELAEAEEGAPDSPAVYLQKYHNYLGGHATGRPTKRNAPPSSLEKLRKLVAAYRTLKLVDSSITIYKAILTGKDKKEKAYRVLRFGDFVGGNNVAILVPIQEASSDASFVWVGQTGEDRDGWILDFSPEKGPDIPTSKNALHNNPRIHVHYHRESKGKNRSATENMWHNIYEDIKKRTQIEIA